MSQSIPVNSVLSNLRNRFYEAYKENAKAVIFPSEDFVKIDSLGRGTYGIVELVRNKKTMQVSAMKIIEMDSVKTERDFGYLLNEKRISNSLYHPFLIGVRNVFKDDTRVFMEMHFYPGGDLYSHIEDHGKCSAEQARFYGAQIAMAIDFLHSVGIVHRDLKPDNIMIDTNGYLRIVDFGFAKVTNGGRMNSLVGTPNYMAPEMYAASSGTGMTYDKSVDWWSYGVVMFTLVTGKEPFSCIGFSDTMNGRVQFPKRLANLDRAFLEALLQVDVERRLGCGQRGIGEIADHLWFAGTNWNAIFFRDVMAPYIPVIGRLHSPEDGNNFVVEKDRSCVEIMDFSDF